MVKKYRKLPVVIEALKYEDTFTFVLKIEDWVGSVTDPIWILPGECIIRTLEGNMKVSEGDYIIKGIHGEFYPCKPDIFEKTYEEVEE